jgi:hypothetical protein
MTSNPLTCQESYTSISILLNNFLIFMYTHDSYDAVILVVLSRSNQELYVMDRTVSLWSLL